MSKFSGIFAETLMVKVNKALIFISISYFVLYLIIHNY